jgi:hypothetical protein
MIRRPPSVVRPPVSVFQISERQHSSSSHNNLRLKQLLACRMVLWTLGLWNRNETITSLGHCKAELFHHRRAEMRHHGLERISERTSEHIFQPVPVDNSLFRQTCGWKPPFTIEEGLEATVGHLADTTDAFRKG